MPQTSNPNPARRPGATTGAQICTPASGANHPMTPTHLAAVEAMARAIEKSLMPSSDEYAHWVGQATAALTALTTLHPGIGAVLRGEAVVVPRKLLAEAHACMRATGWHRANTCNHSGDGVIEAAVAEVEERVGELLAGPAGGGA